MTPEQLKKYRKIAARVSYRHCNPPGIHGAQWFVCSEAACAMLMRFEIAHWQEIFDEGSPLYGYYEALAIEGER